MSPKLGELLRTEKLGDWLLKNLLKYSHVVQDLLATFIVSNIIHGLTQIKLSIMDAFKEEIAQLYELDRSRVTHIVSDFGKTKTLTMEAFEQKKSIEEICDYLLGWTQEEIAELFEIPQQNVSTITHGLTQIKLSVMDAFKEGKSKLSATLQVLLLDLLPLMKG